MFSTAVKTGMQRPAAVITAKEQYQTNYSPINYTVVVDYGDKMLM